MASLSLGLPVARLLTMMSGLATAQCPPQAFDGLFTEKEKSVADVVGVTIGTASQDTGGLSG